VVFLPGLFLIGLGIGTMLTPSVNIVQSAFPRRSRARSRGCRMLCLAVVGLIGLGATLFLSANPVADLD